MVEEKKRSKIPYIFFAFFGVVITVNIFYIYVAKQSWRGLATENSYQKGLNYNSILKVFEKQKDLGWDIETKYIRSDKKSGIIKVDIFDKEKKLITDATVNIIFRRPVQDGFDFIQQLKFSNGTYQANIIFPMPGQWEADISIARGADIFHEVKRYVVE